MHVHTGTTPGSAAGTGTGKPACLSHSKEADVDRLFPVKNKDKDNHNLPTRTKSFNIPTVGSRPNTIIHTSRINTMVKLP
jgi:hypothetical protein